MNDSLRVTARSSKTIVVVAFSLAMVLFLSLGTWQLWRAGQRAASFDSFRESGERPALRAPVDGDEFERYRYRWLELRGHYISTRQILLDSVIHEGRVGYHVLTPFRLLDGGPWLLVNRGWVPADPARRRLPMIDVDEDPRDIRARIDALPRPGLTFADRVERADQWPQVVLFPTFGELEIRLERPLRPYQLLLSSAARDGYVRAWQPRAMPPQRHIGYAIQWYSLALALGVLGAVRWRRATRN